MKVGDCVRLPGEVIQIREHMDEGKFVTLRINTNGTTNQYEEIEVDTDLLEEERNDK